MQFGRLSLTAALASCVVADVPAVLNAISAIANETQNVDTLIPLTQEGVFGVDSVLDLDVATVALAEALESATDTVYASQPFGDDGSQQVATALVNLTPLINKTLSDINVQRQILDNYRPLVLASIYALKEDSDNFAKSVFARGNANLNKAGPIVLSQIDGYFNTSISLYLPPKNQGP